MTSCENCVKFFFSQSNNFPHDLSTPSSIVRSDDLRHENRHRVLKCLRASGRPFSQTLLASESGLSTASISSLLSELVEQGIVTSRRQKNASVARGRPQSRIELNAMAGDIITVNMAFDLISVARMNYTSTTLHSAEHRTSTRALSETDLLTLAEQLIAKMIASPSDSEVRRIGVVFQGVAENASGVLTWSPMLNLEHVNLGAHLQNTFQLPVSVDNDCKLCATALSESFHETLGDSFATIVFSDGVGLGIYIDGEPFSGIRTSALELGHLCFERNGSLCRCGRKGCVEAYAADYGIARLIKGDSIHDDPCGRVDASEMDEFCSLAKAGEEPAIQAFAIAGAAIGEALEMLFTLFDPMPVAIVGRDTEAFKLMQPQIIAVFNNEHARHIPISHLLHCFDRAQPLVYAGLVSNTLTLLDQQFAYLNQS